MIYIYSSIAHQIAAVIKTVITTPSHPQNDQIAHSSYCLCINWLDAVAPNDGRFWPRIIQADYYYILEFVGGPPLVRLARCYVGLPHLAWVGISCIKIHTQNRICLYLPKN